MSDKTNQGKRSMQEECAMGSEYSEDDYDCESDCSLNAGEPNAVGAALPLSASEDGCDELTGSWREAIAAAVCGGEQCMQIERAVVLDRMPASLDSFVDAESDELLDIVEEEDERAAWETDETCTVLLFGCTEKGAPMVVRIKDFRPYIFFEHPNDTLKFRRDLERWLRVDSGCLKYEKVWRRNMYGWVPESTSHPTSRKKHCYLQVFFPTVRLMRRAAAAPGAGQVHEAKISPDTKFLDGAGLTPSGWVRVNGTPVSAGARIFHGGCMSVEVESRTADLVALDRPDIAPMLVAFVDIECVSASMAFPDATKREDEVHQIGVNFWRVGAPKESTVKLLMVQPARCGPVAGCYVERYNSEAELLCGFRHQVMIGANPCVLATFNGFGFDLPYLWKRATLLSCGSFFYCDRVMTHRCEAQHKELSSSALGQNNLFIIDMYGRTNLDLYHWIKAREKLDSYKLDACGEHFLGEKKLDMDYKELFRMARGTPSEIARVGLYCVQDCYLLVQLSIRLQIFAGNVEMSRVCHTPMELLVTRGQQVKVVNQLVWYGHRMEVDAAGQGGYIMNTPNKFSGSAGDHYMGATVIDAKAKFYTDPVATLDFMSLYPSIILANNFCFSTLVQEECYENIAGVDYAIIEFENKRYVWAKNHRGVIPTMMDALLRARKAAKKLMGRAAVDVDNARRRQAESETDADRAAASGALDRALIERAVYNARQLALKVSANSIYGFTGALQNGQYRCLAVADSVTYRAREMLHHTVELVDRFNNGACDVVYGDTDSVMVLFKGADTVEETAKRASATADWITKQFEVETGTEYIVLEFEKVYFPFLLMRKKRYTGLLFEPDDAGRLVQTKLDAKGIELVRRDNCAVAKRCQSAVLDALMHRRDAALAQQRVLEELKRIVADEVPINEYKISKSRRKDYKSQDLAHLQVCRKMAERQPGSEPQVGDRVPYVLLNLKGKPKAKAFEKAEDIGYATRNPIECKIDRLYYVEHQIEKPICSLLQHVVPNPALLFRDAKRMLQHKQTGQRSIAAMLGGATHAQSSSSLQDAMFTMTGTQDARPAKRLAPRKN